MSKQGKAKRQDDLFKEIVELTFEEAGLPKQLQPDMCLVLSERKRIRDVQEQIARLREMMRSQQR